MPRTFDQVRNDLQEAISRLKRTSQDHELRLKILKQLRLLLEEADNLNGQEDSAKNSE